MKMICHEYDIVYLTLTSKTITLTGDRVAWVYVGDKMLNIDYIDIDLSSYGLFIKNRAQSSPRHGLTLSVPILDVDTVVIHPIKPTGVIVLHKDDLLELTGARSANEQQ